jgi:hypothetical protein
MEMRDQLEQQITHYQQWRDDLIRAINAYQAWLDRSGHMDAQQSLRIYDLVENLKKDRLVLAFVAEFSRGKTELVNALFFADFKQRLLPSDVGRTTMCPTEIFYDPDEEPYVRLLPIETRYRDESIATLKHMPVEWSKIKLDTSSPEKMLEAMRALTETKTVFSVEARTLGLWDEDDPTTKDMLKDGNRVEIPAWRYAQINIAHPLLKSGLVILDTPGLNALGTEPELTLSVIPNAHAVLFLLATDTGVTRSDQEIWTRYVEKYVHHRVAVLNKIDMLWDDLKSWEQIQASVQKQLEKTAKQLNLPATQVLAVSAQKALLAKIRGDHALLHKSGIESLENMLAKEIIPSKQAIVRASVLKEIGGMIESSRQSVVSQLTAANHELAELRTLTGKNQDVTKKLRDRIMTDKVRYDESVKNFNLTKQVLSQQGRNLQANLAEERLEEFLEKSRESIQGSWTTAGLTRGMQTLVRQVMRQFDKTVQISLHIKRLLDTAYISFHEKHNFEKLSPPLLSLDGYRVKLHELVDKTEDFCKDPVNIMTEKHFLIKKFYLALVSHAEQIFELARLETQTWLRGALDPLLIQIKEYRSQLERRLDNIKKIHENIDTLQERIRELEGQIASLNEENRLLDEIVAKLMVTHAAEPRLTVEA